MRLPSLDNFKAVVLPETPRVISKIAVFRDRGGLQALAQAALDNPPTHSSQPLHSAALRALVHERGSNLPRSLDTAPTLRSFIPLDSPWDNSLRCHTDPLARLVMATAKAGTTILRLQLRVGAQNTVVFMMLCLCPLRNTLALIQAGLSFPAMLSQDP